MITKATTGRIFGPLGLPGSLQLLLSCGLLLSGINSSAFASPSTQVGDVLDQDYNVKVARNDLTHPTEMQWIESLAEALQEFHNHFLNDRDQFETTAEFQNRIRGSLTSPIANIGHAPDRFVAVQVATANYNADTESFQVEWPKELFSSRKTISQTVKDGQTALGVAVSFTETNSVYTGFSPWIGSFPQDFMSPSEYADIQVHLVRQEARKANLLWAFVFRLPIQEYVDSVLGSEFKPSLYQVRKAFERESPTIDSPKRKIEDIYSVDVVPIGAVLFDSQSGKVYFEGNCQSIVSVSSWLKASPDERLTFAKRFELDFSPVWNADQLVAHINARIAAGGVQNYQTVTNLLNNLAEIKARVAQNPDRDPIPTYIARPRIAIETKETGPGTVVVDIVVDIYGMARDGTVVESTNPAYNEAAIRAAEHSRFQPAYADGEPVESHFRIPYNFTGRKK